MSEPETRSKRRRLGRWLLLGAALTTAATRPGAASRPLEPAVAIPVDRLGYQALPTRFLPLGSTLFTVHFVDRDHLLFTYHVRRLMPRLADADPDDLDRTVAGVLLELPSGRVLARTEWRMRDHVQYLWPLGHGRFLLRIRSRLVLLDPLRDLVNGDAFREHAFIDLHRPIGHVEVSPEGEMLTVETVPPKRKLVGGAASAAALAGTQAAGSSPATRTATNGQSLPGLKRREEEPAEKSAARVELHFFRLIHEEAPAAGGREVGESKTGETDGETDGQTIKALDRLTVRPAGALRAEKLINLPMLSEGYLNMKQESKSVYLFDFQAFSGKLRELSPFDTTCMPSAQFVSRTDFIALGCRGHAGYEELSGFNLQGAEDWIQVLPPGRLAFTLAAAPAAGRFAFSSLASSVGDPILQNLTPDQITAQEILLIQSGDGRVLARLQAMPIQIAGQNFDLAPDGLSFALLRGGNLEIYRLPELTAKDRKQLKLAQSYAPERTEARVHLSGSAQQPAEALGTVEETRPATPASGATPSSGTETSPVESEAGSKQSDKTPAEAAAGVQAKPAPAADTALVAVPDEPRRPPTLYSPDHPPETAPQPR